MKPMYFRKEGSSLEQPQEVLEGGQVSLPKYRPWPDLAISDSALLSIPLSGNK